MSALTNPADRIGGRWRRDPTHAEPIAGPVNEDTPLFRRTHPDDVGAFPRGADYGDCPRCSGTRRLVTEPHGAGTMRLNLACDGCDTRIPI